MKPDNPPLFNLRKWTEDGKEIIELEVLLLRDFFAAAALAGYRAARSEVDARSTAVQAYEDADAMLEKREEA